MATPLSHVPGLGGFLAAQQQQDQQEMMELQRAATLGALLDKARAAQQVKAGNLSKKDQEKIDRKADRILDED